MATSTREHTVLKRAAAGVSTAAVLDIVERLGLVDLVVDRVKGRLQQVDIDELIDEAADYLRRTPEVLVLSLGAITIVAGALVYMNRRTGSTASSSSSRARPKKSRKR